MGWCTTPRCSTFPLRTGTEGQVILVFLPSRIFLWLRSHNWGQFWNALNYWDVFLGDISFYVVLEFVSSVSGRSYPRPKMYRLLWYECKYQHSITNPTTVLLLRPICPEM